MPARTGGRTGPAKGRLLTVAAAVAVVVTAVLIVVIAAAVVIAIVTVTVSFVADICGARPRLDAEACGAMARALLQDADAHPAWLVE